MTTDARSARWVAGSLAMLALGGAAWATGPALAEDARIVVAENAGTGGKPPPSPSHAADAKTPEAKTDASKAATATAAPVTEAAPKTDGAAATTAPAATATVTATPAKDGGTATDTDKTSEATKDGAGKEMTTGALPTATAVETPAAPTATATTPAAADPAATPPAPAATASPPAAAPTATAAAAATTATPTPAAATAAPTAPAAGSVATVPPDAIIAALRPRLADIVGRAHADDVTALTGFYAEQATAIFVDASGLTSRGKAAIDEIRKADDWGLSAREFDLPNVAAVTTGTDALAEAEGKLAREVLKYARYARGGRVEPQSLSRILDQQPQIKDPKSVLTEIASASAADVYLRELHPKHEQFGKLREALLKVRGPQQTSADPVIADHLKIRVPATGKSIKPGQDSAEIATLRQRLQVPVEDGAKDTLFDPKLADAVKAFQAAKGLKATGTITNATRQALNSEGEPPRRRSPEAEETRILINMERWRWLPDDMGKVHVWDNIPEFIARVRRDNKEIFKERIVVGLPAWATPVFSAEMKTIVFNPSWGVPDGIKTRELLPRLRAAGGGFFFFGGGGGGSIIRAYGFTAYRGGRVIDPDTVDWNNVDIRNFSFVQPPGGKNPLGVVKFMFPNRHDVYMHDTIEKQLFAQPYRAYSHGCIRVQNPLRFAEVLLKQDKGWSDDEVRSAISRGGEVALDNHIPVHITYFTALVDDDGEVRSFPDIYGHDTRLSSALTGRSLQSEPFAAPVEVSETGEETAPVVAPGGKGKRAKKSKGGPETLADVIGGFLSN